MSQVSPAESPFELFTRQSFEQVSLLDISYRSFQLQNVIEMSFRSWRSACRKAALVCGRSVLCTGSVCCVVVAAAAAVYHQGGYHSGGAAQALRKKGLAAADKKAGRVAAEGLLAQYIHAGSRYLPSCPYPLCCYPFDLCPIMLSFIVMHRLFADCPLIYAQHVVLHCHALLVCWLPMTHAQCLSMQTQQVATPQQLLSGQMCSCNIVHIVRNATCCLLRHQVVLKSSNTRPRHIRTSGRCSLSCTRHSFLTCCCDACLDCLGLIQWHHAALSLHT